jgi:methyltransferase
MSAALAYAALIGLTALERLVEVRVSNRNAAWAFARGGVEHGRGHFPPMVLLHTAFLLGCVAEVWWLSRPFVPALGLPLVGLAVALQALRWWCITTLGPRWNTRVIVVPGLPRVRGGPYRWMDHPNYVAVVGEGVVLPLIHGAWLTATVFTALNGVLLWWRISIEERALRAANPEAAEAAAEAEAAEAAASLEAR